MMPTSRKPRPRAGFTLIELLVVVTIIVLLIALLMPAMDKAIYEAELAVCGARLKTITTSAITAAMDRKRYFPDLSTMAIQTSSPHKVMVGWGQDMRATYGQYLGGGGLNGILNDPFLRPADIDGSLPSSHAYGNYWMFFGWEYSGTYKGGAGMKRLGDRWTWDGRRYNTFVCDMSAAQSQYPTTVWNSHPDSAGVLFPAWYKDGMGLDTDGLNVTQPAYGYTHSSWVAQTEDRGTVDMNFAASDTSVARYYAVEKLSVQTGEVDDRMVQVPNFAVNNGPPSSTGIVPRSAAE